ncbi:unnamed protein product [Ectocarpus sp. 6 AP-2014]
MWFHKRMSIPLHKPTRTRLPLPLWRRNSGRSRTSCHTSLSPFLWHQQWLSRSSTSPFGLRAHNKTKHGTRNPMPNKLQHLCLPAAVVSSRAGAQAEGSGINSGTDHSSRRDARGGRARTTTKDTTISHVITGHQLTSTQGLHRRGAVRGRRPPRGSPARGRHRCCRTCPRTRRGRSSSTCRCSIRKSRGGYWPHPPEGFGFEKEGKVGIVGCGKMENVDSVILL